MAKINCLKCKHYHKCRKCVYDFRWASGAAGQAVDNIRDVWRCKDFSEIEENENYDKEED